MTNEESSHARQERHRIEREEQCRPAPIPDLAMMLRRIIWQIRKREVNDDSLALLANKAEDLLKVFGLQGDIFRGYNKHGEPDLRLGAEDHGTPT